jgi:hypothetical protein
LFKKALVAERCPFMQVVFTMGHFTAAVAAGNIDPVRTLPPGWRKTAPAPAAEKADPEAARGSTGAGTLLLFKTAKAATSLARAGPGGENLAGSQPVCTASGLADGLIPAPFLRNGSVAR